MSLTTVTVMGANGWDRVDTSRFRQKRIDLPRMLKAKKFLSKLPKTYGS